MSPHRLPGKIQIPDMRPENPPGPKQPKELTPATLPATIQPTDLRLEAAPGPIQSTDPPPAIAPALIQRTPCGPHPILVRYKRRTCNTRRLSTPYNGRVRRRAGRLCHSTTLAMTP